MRTSGGAALIAENRGHGRWVGLVALGVLLPLALIWFPARFGDYTNPVK